MVPIPNDGRGNPEHRPVPPQTQLRLLMSPDLGKAQSLPACEGEGRERRRLHMLIQRFLGTKKRARSTAAGCLSLIRFWSCLERSVPLCPALLGRLPSPRGTSSQETAVPGRSKQGRFSGNPSILACLPNSSQKRELPPSSSLAQAGMVQSS